MDNSRFIRDTIIQNLQREQDFDGMITAETDGINFSAADIALPDSYGNCQVYRIAVVRHPDSVLFKLRHHTIISF